MSRASAVALVFAAAALLAPAFAAAQASPAPGQLWSEDPLGTLTTTLPTASEPGEAPVVEPATRPVDRDASVIDEQSVSLLILLGAAVAAVTGFFGRRRTTRQDEPNEDVEPTREPSVVRSFERPTSARALAATGSVGVLERPGMHVEPAAASALLDALSPQARLADRSEADDAGETHEVCEIACWRGYVTWQFVAESPSPLEPTLASPYFRAPGKGVPEETDAALAAHAALVELLVAAGWEPGGYGEEWFAERFQRPSA